MKVSIIGSPLCSRQASLTCSTPPKLRSAAVRASSADIPLRRFSSTSISRCARTSSLISSSRRLLRKSPSNREINTRHRIMSGSLRAREQPRDDAGEALPAPSLPLELPPPGPGQRIETGAPVVFRDAPYRANPAALPEPQERGVERALVHAQQVSRDLLEAPRDSESVERPERFQGLQHQQVERPGEKVWLHQGPSLDEQQELMSTPVVCQQE